MAISLSLYAENIVDVYGASPEQSIKIVEKYGQKLGELWQSMLIIAAKPKLTKTDEAALKKISYAKQKIMNKIKQESRFLYVDIR